MSDRLKRLATQKGATYADIFTQFLLEPALARLMSDRTLAKHLVFKGGYVSVRVYESPRYTTDLDAVVHTGDKAKVLKLAKTAMNIYLQDHVWFAFEKEIDLVTQNEYGGTRLQFRAGLGTPPRKITRSQIVQLDFGTGDPVTPGPHDMRL
jgi:Nucleotidyl transferase AbiEii toxin, Type IV TA system